MSSPIPEVSFKVLQKILLNSFRVRTIWVFRESPSRNSIRNRYMNLTLIAAWAHQEPGQVIATPLNGSATNRPLCQQCNSIPARTERPCAKLIIPLIPVWPSCRVNLYLVVGSWSPVGCHAAILHRNVNKSQNPSRQVRFWFCVVFGFSFGFGSFSVFIFFFFGGFLFRDFCTEFLGRGTGTSQRLTYRNKATGAVGSSNGNGRVAHELLHGIRGYKVAESDQEGEDEFHTESFPGAHWGTMGDGCLKIALISGNRNSEKEKICLWFDKYFVD